MLVLGTTCCGTGGRSSGNNSGSDESAETSAAAVTTTEDPNKDIDVQIDYDEMANIDTVDAQNENGVGKLYEAGKTADTVHALYWFDFHNVEPEKSITELFAERFGGTVETEIVGSLEINDRLGVLIASGQSPDIMRFTTDFYPSYFINNRFSALDDWLDKDSAVWSEISEIIDRFEYNGKHFYFPYALTTTEYGVTYCSKEIEDYMTGLTSGYVVTSGALNMQGAVSFILASRMYASDSEVVEANREELLYDGGYFYIKCPECKHEFESERGETGETCPECGTPRKTKWKLTYTSEQMQIYDDLVDPSKFTFIFSCHGGFGQDMIDTLDTIYNAPIVDGDTYNHILAEYENIIETTLEEYRGIIAG